MARIAPVKQLSVSRRCVLVGDPTGDSRLAVAVASELLKRGATVVLVAGRDDAGCARFASAVKRNVVDPERCRLDTRPASPQCPPERLCVVPLDGERDLETVLRTEPACLRGAACLLALSEDREQNLRAALIGHRVAPKVPVVLRAFDPDLAEEFESERHNATLSVRRAYSVAHLSAPAFVARALLRKGSSHVLTMRAGVEYVSVCRLRVASGVESDPVLRSRWSKSRGLRGRSPAEIAQHDGCEVLAWRRGDGAWREGTEGLTFQPHDEVVVGGPLSDVLELARGRPAKRIGRMRQRIRTAGTVALAWGRRSRPSGAAHTGPRGPLTLRLQRLIADLERWSRVSRTMSLTLSARLLVVMGLLVTVASVAVTPGHRPSDLLYQWASTALGNPTDASVGGVPEKIMAALGLLAGGVALGLGTSLMSTALIQRRMMEGMYRRARRLKHHVIIVGLGELGVKVAARLRDVGIPCAVVEPSSGGGALELAAKPGFEEVSGHSPVLTGELGQTLDRARIDRADALIACSKDNLVNVEACMRAKRRDQRESIRTIARIFDDLDAMQAAYALGVDEQIAAVREVAPAFADAALEDPPTRTIELDAHEPSSLQAPSERGNGALRLAACKWRGERPVNVSELEAWHRDGIRVLGLSRHTRLRSRPVRPVALATGEVAVLAGPRDAIARLAAERDEGSGAEAVEVSLADASSAASSA